LKRSKIGGVLFFYLKPDSYIYRVNQLNNTHMKTTALEITMKVWAFGLMAVALSAITFAIYKLSVGEYTSTASFMF
jgi:hypothetical protein